MPDQIDHTKLKPGYFLNSKLKLLEYLDMRKFVSKTLKQILHVKQHIQKSTPERRQISI